jgi:hypothetical protein
MGINRLGWPVLARRAGRPCFPRPGFSWFSLKKFRFPRFSGFPGFPRRWCVSFWRSRCMLKHHRAGRHFLHPRPIADPLIAFCVRWTIR